MEERSASAGWGPWGWALIAAILLVSVAIWVFLIGARQDNAPPAIDTRAPSGKTEPVVPPNDPADTKTPTPQTDHATTTAPGGETGAGERTPDVTGTAGSVVTPATPDPGPVPEALDPPQPAGAVGNLPAPVIDVVRVDPDGNAVIAGTAPPGSRVVLMMDDVEIEAPQAGPDGGFVSLLTLPMSDSPRVLTLRAEQDGRIALSTDQIIIAPSPATASPVPPPPAAGAPASPPAAGSAPQTDQLVAEAPANPAAPPSPEEAPARPTDPAVFRSGTDGVEVLQSPDLPDPVPARVTLDTISYSTEGAVMLRGTSRRDTVVRVYLDNRPVTDLATNARGRFRGEIGAVEPGLYTLRLDEVDAGGRVLSRLETPFKREAPEALQPVAPTADKAGSPVRAVTVQTGDTLWAISRERYGEGVLYVKVVEANRDSIRDPDLIYPGQVFAIPD